MTIKEFAALCRCNPQTLRYYDRIGLLKPARVDPWTGYRYYDSQQAVAFVKIKNLQAAEFSIGEIKSLLTKPDREVYDAFSAKIAAQEEKLARIRQIQQSYLKEKTSMEKLVNTLTDFLLSQLGDAEMLREFGLQPEDKDRIVSLVRDYMNSMMLQGLPAEENLTLRVNEEIFRGAEQVADRIAALKAENLADTVLLGDETMDDEPDFDPADYDTVWEAQGWDHVYEFIDRIPPMENDGDYCYLFRLNEASYREDLSFPMYMLGAMLLKKGEVKILMGCSVSRSDDGQNAFCLMKKR